MDDDFEPHFEDAVRKELTCLIDRLDLDALASRASQLRNGIPCIVAVPSLQGKEAFAITGNVNLHLELEFDDDVCWIARIKRQNATTPPEPIQRAVIASEAATYRFLETIDVPAPRVYEACSNADNPVRATYILMAKVPGRPLSHMTSTEGQMSKVLDLLADIYVILSQHPFNSVGSLYDGNHMGPITTETLAAMTPDHTNADMLGPFDTLQEYYTAAIARVLSMIESGELHSRWRKDSFLIHRHLLAHCTFPPENSPLHTSASFTAPNSPCFLRHPDDLGSHILVDDHFNVTGIIDWEWAFTARAEVAFTSPMLIWDVGKFFDGEDGLSKMEERFAEMLDKKSEGRDLGKYVRQGRFWQRLRWCVGADLIDGDFESYIRIFMELRRLAGEKDMEWEEWKMWATEEYVHGLNEDS